MVELNIIDEVPEVERRKGSKYEKILNEFLERNINYAEVVLNENDPKPETVYQQLNKFAKNYTGIKVMKRKEKIYLVKEVTE
ncbi:MAG: hypothetical protein ACTSPB_03575 [Candidatus Thorarchaeota archaeon]